MSIDSARHWIDHQLWSSSLGGFGGIEGVIEGKSEIYQHFINTGGTIILNIDDPLQRKWMSYNPHYTYGEDPDADCCVKYLKRKHKPTGIDFRAKNN